MPCMSYESDWASSSKVSEVIKIKEEADKLARIACRAMAALEKLDPSMKAMNKEAMTWWEKHKEADRKRMAEEAKVKAKEKEKEKLRSAALSKLTPEEIKAFGIKV